MSDWRERIEKIIGEDIEHQYRCIPQIGKEIIDELESLIAEAIKEERERILHVVVKDYLEGRTIESNPARQKIADRFRKLIEEDKR